MSASIRVEGRRRLSLGLLLVVALLPSCVLRNACGGDRPGDEEPAITREQHDALAAAQELLNRQDARGAVAKVQALLPAVADQPYALALTQQVLGYAEAAAGDLKAAAAAFAQALRPGVLPAGVAHAMTYHLAQVEVQDGQYKAAAQVLETWFKDERAPSIESHELAAVAYTRSNQCAQALPHLDAIVKGGRQVDAAWSQALLACHIDLKRFDAATATIDELLRRSPQNKAYWMQAIALRRQNKQEAEAMALMALANSRGLLDVPEIVSLARMYLSANLPLKAANLLAGQINAGTLARDREVLELLAESWRLAQEKRRAMAVYGEIMKISPDGETALRMGQLAVEQENWPDAQQALQTALRQPGFKDVATANLLLGIAAAQQQNYVLAQAAIGQAMKYKDTHDLAAWWWQKLQTNTTTPVPAVKPGGLREDSGAAPATGSKTKG